MKRFSFVIPTFNKGQLLRNTLECLNTQNGYGRDDYEVIVVDDGSTNNEFDLIKDMPRNFDMKYIYLDRNSDSCRSKTRNEGWKNAGGKIITFLDADVLIDNNFLSEIDRCFSIDSNISISSNIIWTNHEVAFEDVKSGEIFNKYAFTKDRIDIMEERHYIFSRYSYNPAALNIWNWLVSKLGADKVVALNHNKVKAVHWMASENIQNAKKILGSEVIIVNDFDFYPRFINNLEAYIKNPNPRILRAVLCAGCRYGISGRLFEEAAKYNIRTIVNGSSYLESVPFKSYIMKMGEDYSETK